MSPATTHPDYVRVPTPCPLPGRSPALPTSYLAIRKRPKNMAGLGVLSGPPANNAR